jgi:predicted DNA-binding transcriptional regulator AlpA
MVDPNELIENEDAAKVLRVKPATLNTWRTHGYGPEFLKVGRRVLYRRSDVLAWIESRRRAPSPAASRVSITA